MRIALSTPDAGELSGVVRVLREWQHDAAAVPLHPGDVGWHWRFGARDTAGALRTWSGDGRMLAAGLLDGPGLLRLALAPDAEDDRELAGQMLADVSDPERGVLPEGEVYVEARFGGSFRELMLDGGWSADELWTPLRRDLADPVEDSGVRVEVVGPERIAARVAVQRAAFANSTFTDQRWRAMAAGTPYADARCLIAYDGQATPVGVATVWSAGPGRPGLLEPMGVDSEHRGHGYGRAITLAAAAALREMRSSSATVCTPSSNLAAVATYRSAGFQPLPEVADLRRP